MQNIEDSRWAKISIIYIDNRYESIFLDLKDDENLKKLMLISEYGTSEMNQFKLPTSKSSFMIFSREQLDHCIFELKLFKTKPRKKKTDKVEMIKS